jgi:hypothetical protein
LPAAVTRRNVKSGFDYRFGLSTLTVWVGFISMKKGCTDTHTGVPPSCSWGRSIPKITKELVICQKNYRVELFGSNLGHRYLETGTT